MVKPDILMAGGCIFSGSFINEHPRVTFFGTTHTEGIVRLLEGEEFLLSEETMALCQAAFPEHNMEKWNIRESLRFKINPDQYKSILWSPVIDAKMQHVSAICEDGTIYPLRKDIPYRALGVSDYQSMLVSRLIWSHLNKLTAHMDRRVAVAYPVKHFATVPETGRLDSILRDRMCQAFEWCYKELPCNKWNVLTIDNPVSRQFRQHAWDLHSLECKQKLFSDIRNALGLGSLADQIRDYPESITVKKIEEYRKWGTDGCAST